LFGDFDLTVPTPFRTFQVRVEPFPNALTPAQSEAARQLTTELRFGLENGSPLLVQSAVLLARAVSDQQRPPSRGIDASLATRRYLDHLADFLEEQLTIGRLIVLPEFAIANVPERELTARRPKADGQPPESPTSRREAPPQTAFEVRFVDEIGQAISKLDVQITAGDQSEKVSTNSAGVALLEGTTTGSGTVAVLDTNALAEILDPRWALQRRGTAPRGLNTTQISFDGGGVAAVDIKAGVPNTVVITPVLGKIQMELLDKTGRVRHLDQRYTISGPVSLSGTTDENGGLLHENVPAGDYTLTLSLGSDMFTSPAEVLESSDPQPQVRLLGAVPYSRLARLRGLVFETNKSFVLPAAIPAFVRLRKACLQNNPSELLVIGHTDTTAEPTINDPLSLERAECTAAFVTDDADAWLKKYDQSTPVKRRWGSHEDQLMLQAMPDFGTKPLAEDAVRWYQRTRGLTLDGIAGPELRSQLIAEYMTLDGPPFADIPNLTMDITSHGCGENFPLDDSGDEVDTQPSDSKADQLDRRVELFFFDAEFGIKPAVPGKNSPKGSTQYLEWRKNSLLLHEFESDAQQGLIVEWSNDLDAQLPEDLKLSATQDGSTQELRWANGVVDSDSGYRQFVFSRILGNDPVTLSAASDELSTTLVLWQDQIINDPENPPQWQHWLDEMIGAAQPDGALVADGALPNVSDSQARPEDFSSFFDV